jgi:DNA replication and repair protein RecF
VTPSHSYRISRLTLTGYRNYHSLRVEPPRGLICLTGPNGAGKTNLLEAISLLVPGRGLRGAEFQAIARQGGSGSWAVSAEALTPIQETQIGTAWEPAEEKPQASRAVMIDGLLQKSSGTLAGLLRIVWLTPAMDRLFAGSPGERRRFLDRMVAVFDPEHSSRLAAYEKLMRERNALLEGGSFDTAWLGAIEGQMAEVAVAIAHARIDATEVLGRHLRESDASPFPWGMLAIKGDTEALVASRPAVQAEDDLRQQFVRGRGTDKAAGRTLHGPHRSDLAVTHGPKNMEAELCSTGEQKALLIGLVLAQAKALKSVSGAAPILLLDEVAAHLDKARRIGLFGLLEELQCQAWMTGTEAQLFDGAGASAVVYQVENNSLNESNLS